MKHCVWIFCLLMVIGCDEISDWTTPVELKKLRQPYLRESWREVCYDLVIMGHDAAVDLLIRALRDENSDARSHAISILKLEFQDTRALPALTKVFLHDTQVRIREQAASALASIDAKYTADLMAQHLNADDKETQDIAVKLLSELKDERVIPTLVKRLNNFVEHKEGFFRVEENGSLIPEKDAFEYVRQETFTLAEFKHRRAVPVLFRMLTAKDIGDSSKEIAAKYLAQYGETQAIPYLLELLDSDARFSKPLQQFGPVVVPFLLEKLRQTDSDSFRYNIVSILRQIRDPELAPLYGQLYLEALQTKDWTLKQAMIQTLPNMGTAGMKTLIIIIQDPNFKKSGDFKNVLLALETYNNTAALEAVVALAIDVSLSKQSRWDAIRSLNRFVQVPNTDVSRYIHPLLTDNDPFVKLSALDLMYRFGLFETKDIVLSKHLSQLLADNDPVVKLSTLRFMLRNDLFETKDMALPKYIKQLLTDNDPATKLNVIRFIQDMKLIEMKPVLVELIETSYDKTIQDAACAAWHTLSEKHPLTLNLKMSQERYAYEEPIELRYTFVNTSIYPIKILRWPRAKTWAQYVGYRISRNIDLQQPDGTLSQPFSPQRVLIDPQPRPTREDHRTLLPGKKIKGTVQVHELFHPSYHVPVPDELSHGLHQSGKYTLRCSVLEWTPLEWTPVKTELHFYIEPPTANQLNAMLEKIDLKRITEENPITSENSDKIIKICHQMGELLIPETIPALKKLALLNPYEENRVSDPHGIKWAAVETLKKFSDPDLIPMWIEFLDDGNWIESVIEKVGESGDTRAIKPLQRIAYGGSIYRGTQHNRLTQDRQIIAALALQKLGDNSGIEWLRKIASRKLQSRYPSERTEGDRILRRLYPRYNTGEFSWRLQTLVYDPNPDIIANWERINERINKNAEKFPGLRKLLFHTNRDVQRAAAYELGGLKDPSGLKKFLSHANPDVQRAAAYELAYLGDPSGVHLIQQDLDANEAKIRTEARDLLFKIQTDQRK